ncbi:sulfite oxidase [Chloropicon primus]|uniref:sulfite oxidase n=1 Tax=Chloropicon primus TaxID=1764295 RepID=A0A5B8MAT7_9CHLO|nr:sulfite oxidase [Chloropicon primus]UPQ96786.1 sulfite oxidase [Chloropicon primus]|mmetsp:Transcript_12388/g.34485  ORF Transcript_12388/g.34485 Transcript_12388/m.34485 type:complete len:590 (-) Transcript_12388:1330-3099(-)|eukprot:QDZ17568.1 sulfite oxidase [Chloropicon primus]
MMASWARRFCARRAGVLVSRTLEKSVGLVSSTGRGLHGPRGSEALARWGVCAEKLGDPREGPLFARASAAGALLLGATTLALATEGHPKPRVVHAEAVAPAPGRDLPVFSRGEVEGHDTLEKGIWVICGDKVYDITEFVQNHPGGASKIMLAAGKSVEPFWQIYQQHLGNPAVQEILGDLQIGWLDPKDVAGMELDLDRNDPYAREPKTHPALSVHYAKPVNAEIPPSLLMDSWITPNDLWYVRHHHPVPVEHIEGRDKLSLELGVSLGGSHTTQVLSLQDLKEKFEKKKVVATMQCGGNRRGGLNGVDDTKGTSWDVGAISNAEWAGVSLLELLRHMGVEGPEDAEKKGIKHVQFESHDGMTASIPIEKALNPYGDTIIAYEMNGVDIPKKNGYPLRAIVPGVVGVRNVKWLKSITLSSEEAEGPWQRGMNYKVFSPSVKDLNSVDIASVPTIQEQPVQSVIVSPQDGETLEVVPEEELEIKGYSWSGGGRGVIRVDVSIDSGKSWHTATLKEGSEQNPMRAWAWTFWEVSIPVPVSQGKVATKVDICCKATDYAHNCQPETPDSIWNLRGLNNNSWHHVNVNLDDVS